MAGCPSCGEANPARARFCLACGARFPEPAAARETRRTVTIVFSDVIDSTPLGERLDAETYRRVMSRYFAEVSRVLERHGGTVEKFIGDAVMAVFGIPAVHEDDALRAVRAAAELRETLAELNEELRRDYGVELAARTGIDTGEVVAGDPAEGQAFATGEAVVVAQRLESAASAGEILIGEATQRLVRHAVLVEPVEPMELKGKAEPVRTWRLLGVVTGAPAFARRLDSPLVGRERELSLLMHAFQRAVDERACHLFTVLGAAGVGKSRLVNELLDSLGAEARVLYGRCVPYGEGITFWPLTELVRQAASVTPSLTPEETRARIASLVATEPEAELVVDRLAVAIGLADGGGTNEETFWAVRKLLEALAREGPIVVSFDDIHWAEPTFLDLVDHLADWTRNMPILIVCLARPELLDERPTWGGGKLNATSILLEPLREADVDLLIENLVGEGEVSDEIRLSLHETGEGNPLFVEELLSMLIDDGRLYRQNGRWSTVVGIAPLTAPPTIQAILAARIDRLEAKERDLLELAAVVGRIFSRETLAVLAPERERLDERLAALVHKDLIQPEGMGEEAFRFRHIVIRDAAYQGLAKERRAEAHERFAAWLEESQPGRLREVLGYHLEQAYHYRLELAPGDGHTKALAGRAAELLAEAGRRALGRGDMPAAAGLLTRTAILLREDDAARRKLAADLASALIAVGQFSRAEGVLDRTVTEARAVGDRGVELRTGLELAELRLRMEPATSTDELLRVAEEAIAAFDETGDEAGLTRAWVRIGDVHWMASNWAKRTEALERALVHARRAGDPRQEGVVLGSLALSLSWGTTPVPEAIRRCQEMLDGLSGDRALEARILVILAELHAMLGEFDEARSLYARSSSLLEELGLKLMLAVQRLVGGTVELLAGDPQAAEAELRRGYETLKAMGEQISRSTVAAVLGEALYAQGRYDEAEQFAELSEVAAPAEDVVSQNILRGTRAKILARRGELGPAEELAREAVALADGTDAINMQADALMNLAEVLRLGEREEEARSIVARAGRLYEQKGNLVSLERATQLAGRGLM